MGSFVDPCTENDVRRSRGLAWILAVGLAGGGAGCAAAPPPKPSEPLTTGEPSWPESVTREAERAERICGARESKLLREQQEGKEEQQKFKTLMGSITGGVGTVGGVLGGVGSFVINSPDTVKTMTGVTGFVSAGLGAVGSVVTAVVSPGKEKLEASSKALATIDEKKAAARDVLTKKDPSMWSDAEKEAWSKASKELESACK